MHEFLELNKFTVNTHKSINGTFAGIVGLDIFDPSIDRRNYILSSLIGYQEGYKTRYRARKAGNKRLSNWIIKHGISLSYAEYMEIKENCPDKRKALAMSM